MNPDNNFGNGMGQDNFNSQSLGGFTPNNDTISPVGPISDTVNQAEETFSPFANLDVQNQPVVDNTQNVNPQPVASDMSFDNINIPAADNQAAPINDTSFNFDTSFTAPAENNNVQPVETFTAPVEPAANMEAFNQPVNNAPVEPSPIPTLENNVNNALNEVLEMPVADELKQPEVQQAPQIEPLTSNYQQGPTMPIPDQMPTSTYQAGVSTPVDYATPMSDFDQIGTTPELDPKAKSKGKSNKTLVFLLLLIAIAGLGAGSYYLINVKKIFNSSSVKTKDITVEKDGVLSENINDYATFENTSSSNCVQDVSNVDTTTVGSYKYTIKCGEDVYEGKVTVVDTTAPSAKTKAVLATVNSQETIEPLSFIDVCTEENCDYTFNDESQISSLLLTPGIKFVGINVSDNAGNTRLINAPLVVLDSTFKLELFSEKQSDLSNDSMFVKEKNITIYTDTFVAYTVYEIKYNSEEEFLKLYKENSNNSTLTIESISGNAIYDVNNLTVYIVPSSPSEYSTADYAASYQLFNDNGYQNSVLQSDSMNFGF